MATKKNNKPVEVPTEVVEAPTKPAEVKYTKEALLASTEFSGYQKDFVSAILTKPEYTLAEAHKALSAYFKKKEK